MTPTELRRRIAKDHRGRLKWCERVSLLRHDDAALLRLHGAITAGIQAGLSCAAIYAKLGQPYVYNEVKAMARTLALLKRYVPPPDSTWRQQQRDERGQFRRDDEYLAAPQDKAAIRARWLADGVAPDTADRWLREMGTTEGLT